MENSKWAGIYKIGGAAALGAVLVGLADPSTSQTPVILNKQAPHPQLRGLRLSPGGRQVALVDGGAVYVYPIP
jgi:hypothetical protein